MTAYDSYMKKQALNAYMKRVDWSPELDVRFNQDDHLGYERQVSGFRLNPTWRPDSQGLGSLRVNRRNVPPETGPGPSRTGSIDWISSRYHTNIQLEQPVTPAQRASVAVDLPRKMLGRAAWQAKQEGLLHMAGDWTGNYTPQGRKLIDRMLDKHVAPHAAVRHIEGPWAHPFSRAENGVNTPVFSLQDFFASKTRQPHPAVGPADMLASGRPDPERWHEAKLQALARGHGTAADFPHQAYRLYKKLRGGSPVIPRGRGFAATLKI